VVFTANPPTIDAGTSTKLCWQVNGATNITITPGVGSNLNANDCATVSPTTTTTYTLTATNATGQIQANVTVTVGQVRILSFTADPGDVNRRRQPGGPEVADFQRRFDRPDRRRTRAADVGSEWISDGAPDHQLDVHLDGVRTRRSNRKRHHLGIREVT